MERLKTLTFVDLEKARREVTRADSMTSSLLPKSLWLRAESLALLIRYSAAKANTDAVLTYLVEFSAIRNILPRSRDIAEADLGALSIACDSPGLAIEEERFSGIKSERSELSAALSQESKQWETMIGYRTWISENLVDAWHHQRR